MYGDEEPVGFESKDLCRESGLCPKKRKGNSVREIVGEAGRRERRIERLTMKEMPHMFRSDPAESFEKSEKIHASSVDAVRVEVSRLNGNVHSSYEKTGIIFFVSR